MHLNNIHNRPYDFTALINTHEVLETFVFINAYGKSTIDFSNQKAVLELNKAILKHHYGLKDWNIPEGYLCPPIPGRVDYIHHLADVLLKEGVTTKIKGLDIGMGANCIYPILGSQVYDWRMVGSDIEKKAVVSAKNNIKINKHLSDAIEIRHQTNNANIFEGIIKDEEYFDFTMCNPPFHASQEEASKGTLKKLKNLGISEHIELNFGGQANELWCNGGEALFLKRMIKQSVPFAKQVGFFTSLVSKKENLPKLEKQLNKMKATHTTITMEQGNKKSRFITWKF
ncbi:23S rRNA m(6)A-1618 methyltransferase [Aquimarina sp. MAR_2010_214]|uniref:23S rRNA (adenine(1618)-N(6))-methyltransferase RlmF n=1 Tax=Aquimarina sp. MAR_2010_214 TaxID=1250026 RepID=UPI000C70BFBC|nr:23S rRNA (adenine(1618)-N(6))-methyltransferase RlmF [Aquimarina sp. MAR_2010_214]PKV51285.1 23S rRNA m(6)A-1618 methyltransferase [Aquimarina sp. MAR_2010_214]